MNISKREAATIMTLPFASRFCASISTIRTKRGAWQNEIVIMIDANEGCNMNVNVKEIHCNPDQQCEKGQDTHVTTGVIIKRRW